MAYSVDDPLLILLDLTQRKFKTVPIVTSHAGEIDRKINAEGATAPETLRQMDRLDGMKSGEQWP
jgi:hypothetical protein